MSEAVELSDSSKCGFARAPAFPTRQGPAGCAPNSNSNATSPVKSGFQGQVGPCVRDPSLFTHAHGTGMTCTC